MWISLGILVTTLAFVSADTPANCTYEDVKGYWIFQESEQIETRDVNCSQFLPNTTTNDVRLELDYPNVATDDAGNVGTWTLIYNQGFEVIINYRKYFAFSLYKQSGSTVTSYCHQTSPGWSHDLLGNNWACIKGNKVAFNWTHPTKDSFVEKTHQLSPLMLESLAIKPYSSEHLVRQINSQQSSWTAKVYSDWEVKTPDEHINMAGGRASRLAHRPKPSEPSEEVKREASKLPESFDWRNVSGVNYVSPVRAQGGCGSCYAFASAAALEARIRIATNNRKTPIFSTQHIVDCAQYAQGCAGGFPYLIAGKYAQDYGVIEEECYPYVGRDQKCFIPHGNLTTKCRKRTYTYDYHYIGGFYGGCNEELMRLELVRNGPVVVNIEAYPDLKHYSHGVYSHHVNTSFYMQTAQDDAPFNPFELTNHVVLVVGYGVDKPSGEKYWIVKNSWGPQWGLDGYFWIKRGVDECAIESLAVAVTPIP